MIPLKPGEVVVQAGVSYRVTDRLEPSFRNRPPGKESWYVLENEDEEAALLLRLRGRALTLFLPLSAERAGTPPAMEERIRFSSTTGAWTKKEILPYAEDPAHATIWIGSDSYLTAPVELNEDGELVTVDDQQDERARLADLIALGIAPLIGVFSLFAVRFSFTTVLLTGGILAALLVKFERTLTATYHSLAAAMSAFLALSPLTLLAGLGGAQHDNIATVLVIFSIPIALHYPVVRRRLVVTAIPVVVAALIPFAALVLWCLIDEDWSWFEDWLRFYRVGGFAAPIVYAIALTRPGRRWLKRVGAAVRSS